MGILVAGGSASVHLGGMLSALGAGASYAVYAMAAKRLLDAGSSPDAVMAASFGTGALLLSPLLLFVPLGWVATASGAVMVLFLGAVATALAYWLFARGLRRLSAAETSTLTLAEPATAGFLGIAVL